MREVRIISGSRTFVNASRSNMGRAKRRIGERVKPARMLGRVNPD